MALDLMSYSWWVALYRPAELLSLRISDSEPWIQNLARSFRASLISKYQKSRKLSTKFAMFNKECVYKRFSENVQWKSSDEEREWHTFFFQWTGFGMINTIWYLLTRQCFGSRVLTGRFQVETMAVVSRPGETKESSASNLINFDCQKV